MAEVIVFVRDELGDVYKHITHPWMDYTLCGITMDGDEKTAGSYVVKRGRINCPRCIEIIKYCKKFNARDIKK